MTRSTQSTQSTRRSAPAPHHSTQHGTTEETA
jgi:hypothetical protein